MKGLQLQDPAQLSQLDDYQSAACLAYEQQGFINGFRLGMKLAEELRGAE